MKQILSTSTSRVAPHDVDSTDDDSEDGEPVPKLIEAIACLGDDQIEFPLNAPYLNVPEMSVGFISVHELRDFVNEKEAHSCMIQIYIE